MIICHHYSEGLKERKDYVLEEILEGLSDGNRMERQKRSGLVAGKGTQAVEHMKAPLKPRKMGFTRGYKKDRKKRKKDATSLAGRR